MLALTLCACERFSMASGELNRSTVVKEILITAQSGARGTSDEKIRYYNLDAIISIEYRVNSIRATSFAVRRLVLHWRIKNSVSHSE